MQINQKIIRMLAVLTILIIGSVLINISAQSQTDKSTGFLHVSGRNILDSNGNPIKMEGIVLGNWLLYEGVFLSLSKKTAPDDALVHYLKEIVGEKRAEEFFPKLRENITTEDDIRRIKEHGFNLVSVLVSSWVLEDWNNPYSYKKEGFAYIDNLVKWANKYDIFVRINLVNLPGGEWPNRISINDKDKKALLWKNEGYQDRTIALWKEIAKRYKNETCIMAYNLLNEPTGCSAKNLIDFYNKLIKAIRPIDNHHIFILNGPNWAVDLTEMDPGLIEDKNVVWDIHTYVSNYPKKVSKEELVRLAKKRLDKYRVFQKKYNVPIMMGEIGTGDGEKDQWFILNMNYGKENGWSWSYFLYKETEKDIFALYRDCQNWQHFIKQLKLTKNIIDAKKMDSQGRFRYTSQLKKQIALHPELGEELAKKFKLSREEFERLLNTSTQEKCDWLDRVDTSSKNLITDEEWNNAFESLKTENFRLRKDLVNLPRDY